MAIISAGSGSNLSGLAKRLVADGFIDIEAAQDATQESQKEKIPFVTHLVQKKLVTAFDIATAAADEFGVPLIDLSVIDTEVIPGNLVKQNLNTVDNVGRVMAEYYTNKDALMKFVSKNRKLI